MTSSDPPPNVFMLPGRDRRMTQGHPWVFSNEIRMDAAAKAIPAGSVVLLHRVDGKPLGVGTFNPRTLICFRLFDRDPRAQVDERFIAGRLASALALRSRLYPTAYYRLVHGEADGLPGLVADRYGDVVVLQSGTAGMDALLPPVIAAVRSLLSPGAVIVRNDSPFRQMEGLETKVEVAFGAVEGPVEVREGGPVFLADLQRGQKTGWFYDQRDNRAFVAKLATGLSVLDVYCYIGGFTLAAAAAGAKEAVGIDSSEKALDLARRAAALNKLEERCSFRSGEAFQSLESLAKGGKRYDVVVSDPPAFVKSAKDLKPGLRGYRKLAALSAAVVAPGGFLFIASCSHAVGLDAFAGEVAAGLSRAGRTGRILRTAGAGADHPVHPHLPESAYLKALTLQLS
ncbi:MAG: class I SAM-dependent rRNA methyltransferase [Rhodospirillales bacterium]|nr:class I SAM-dependent rRNA methyltransferase [Rhodospirillales bacterium]